MTDVHLIWIGGPLPAWAQRALSMWREQVADVVLWDDARVAEHPDLERVVAFGQRKGLSLRGVADLLRIRILDTFGGIYHDIDTVPLRTASMLARPLGWVGVFPGRHVNHAVLMNGTLAFPAQHPALSTAWALAFEQIRAGKTDEHHVAGPGTWAKVQRQEPVPLIEAYPVVTSGSLPRRFAQAEALDLDELREEYPGAEALHVIYSRRHAR